MMPRAGRALEEIARDVDRTLKKVDSLLDALHGDGLTIEGRLEGRLAWLAGTDVWKVCVKLGEGEIDLPNSGK